MFIHVRPSNWSLSSWCHVYTRRYIYICICLYCKCSCIFMVYVSVCMYSPPNRLMMCSLWNSGQCNDHAHPLRMEMEKDPNWSGYLDDQLHEDRSLVAGAIQIYILFGIYGPFQIYSNHTDPRHRLLGDFWVQWCWFWPPQGLIIQSIPIMSLILAQIYPKTTSHNLPKWKVII